MITHPFSIRAVLLVAATASFLTLSGCNSGPHQQPEQTPAPTHGGKDGKEMPVMKSSGPHQGS